MEELVTLRRDLLRDLPMDIRRARRAYRRVAREVSRNMDAKSYAMHQAACKAGLSHLEGLIKLLRWACEGPGADGVDGAAGGDAKKREDAEIEKLIAEARGALAEV
ncbi:hypothetical protein [Thalassospira alkalitolerans]|uniref:Uncharacterized protein n=1 Tax=Thalassospira alkalitolerans TaxID=1293890 RepID=A0A1Y2LA10_9PROT|nr:hypothetical protein [Thalassospira alkalitolerans]OSQ47443.1 hypothetical protein TALK_12970 [Thalassospira alkalitolerans]